mmetsp:Transcript_37410/g.119999  ORF Transcript_37410/g.119999 Transcript_37410/m.119999 type:complete len:376 (-) Transcript_37410:433-1560(-)
MRGSTWRRTWRKRRTRASEGRRKWGAWSTALTGMRSMLTLPATSTRGPTKAASSAASSSRSLTPAMRVAAIMRVRVLLAGRRERASMRNWRSSFTEYLEWVGTSWRLKWSFAECTDHARAHGALARTRKASGPGPTVDAVTFAFARPKRKSSVKISAALAAFSALTPASPMPKRTTFVNGFSVSSAYGIAQKYCAAISQAVKFLRRPIVAVAQNRQPRSQPTCVDTQRVVLGLYAWGINTVSTASPSARRTNSFVVPSAAFDAVSVSAGTNRVIPALSNAARVGRDNSSPPPKRGSTPRRRASQIVAARPVPPTSAPSSGTVFDSVAGCCSPKVSRCCCWITSKAKKKETISTSVLFSGGEDGELHGKDAFTVII